MFKKIVSNLPYSPSLVANLGFYVKRLRREEATRRAGLIFTALALVVQGLVVFAPAEAQASASTNDIVYGGFRDKNDLLQIYDKGVDSGGRKDIQQIYNYFGVTRADIENTYLGRINSKDFNSGIYSTGRVAYNIAGSDEQAKQITGTNTTIYMRKLRSFDAGNQIATGNGYAALIGKRSVDGKWFAIVLACGNVDFTSLPPAPKPTPTPPKPTPTPPKPTPAPPQPCALNSSIAKSSSECKACSGDTSLWYKDTACVPAFVTNKTVSNLTTATTNANNTTASSGDRLEYTLSVKNVGKTSGTYTMKDTVSDVLEYATIVDQDNGVLSSVASSSSVSTVPDTISWPVLTIAPGQTAEKKFVVQVKADLPTAPQNISNPISYDCRMSNSFGPTTTVNVNCPPVKTVEQVTGELPKTGPSENLIFAGAVASVVVYFYARSRQLGREVRLIRRDFNAGTL